MKVQLVFGGVGAYTALVGRSVFLLVGWETRLPIKIGMFHLPCIWKAATSFSVTGKVYIDGWTASLNGTLQHYKEDVKIVF